VDIRSLTKWSGALFLAIAFLLPQSLQAQEAAKAQTFKTEELDQMLAPIALYPDDLLSNVLMASTYPLEVVQAARWRAEPANTKLQGDALAKALEAQSWDPSVKSLVQFPDVLQTMSEKLEWTQKLGDAFLAQQDDVMDRIQFLRKKAEAAGNLKTNSQQKVAKQDDYIVIEPASPDVVYVPVYQPTVVYGDWWYPSYPPYYWYWGRPASAFVSGFFWGTGFAVANSLWGWGHCDWRHRNIDINVNRYNRINVNQTQITSNTWKHDAAHRGSVPYRDKASREKFGKGSNLTEARKDFRGFDDGKTRDRVQGKLSEGGAGNVKDRISSGGGSKITNKAGTKAATNIPKKTAARPASTALDVKPASQVKRQVDRGSASRKAASSHAARAGSRGGGGARRGGSGGGRGGGGGRRR
jgi:hypothetical protein